MSATVHLRGTHDGHHHRRFLWAAAMLAMLMVLCAH